MDAEYFTRIALQTMLDEQDLPDPEDSRNESAVEQLCTKRDIAKENYTQLYSKAVRLKKRQFRNQLSRSDNQKRVGILFAHNVSAQLTYPPPVRSRSPFTDDDVTSEIKRLKTESRASSLYSTERPSNLLFPNDEGLQMRDMIPASSSDSVHNPVSGKMHVNLVDNSRASNGKQNHISQAVRAIPRDASVWQKSDRPLDAMPHAVSSQEQVRLHAAPHGSITFDVGEYLQKPGVHIDIRKILPHTSKGYNVSEGVRGLTSPPTYTGRSMIDQSEQAAATAFVREGSTDSLQIWHDKDHKPDIHTPARKPGTQYFSLSKTQQSAFRVLLLHACRTLSTDSTQRRSIEKLVKEDTIDVGKVAMLFYQGSVTQLSNDKLKAEEEETEAQEAKRVAALADAASKRAKAQQKTSRKIASRKYWLNQVAMLYGSTYRYNIQEEYVEVDESSKSMDWYRDGDIAGEFVGLNKSTGKRLDETMPTPQSLLPRQPRFNVLETRNKQHQLSY
ncbi:MAG: hypothetical protein Q9227_009537 [Pyrenula ochraceoflavens]